MLPIELPAFEEYLNHEEWHKGRHLRCTESHSAWYEALLVAIQAQHVSAHLLLSHVECPPLQTCMTATLHDNLESVTRRSAMAVQICFCWSHQQQPMLTCMLAKMYLQA